MLTMRFDSSHCTNSTRRRGISVNSISLSMKAAHKVWPIHIRSHVAGSASRIEVYLVGALKHTKKRTHKEQ